MSGLSGPTVPSWMDIGLMVLQKCRLRKRDRYVSRYVGLPRQESHP